MLNESMHQTRTRTLTCTCSIRTRTSVIASKICCWDGPVVQYQVRALASCPRLLAHVQISAYSMTRRRYMFLTRMGYLVIGRSKHVCTAR